jgi:hypothetical protein
VFNACLLNACLLNACLLNACLLNACLLNACVFNACGALRLLAYALAVLCKALLSTHLPRSATEHFAAADPVNLSKVTFLFFRLPAIHQTLRTLPDEWSAPHAA